MSNKWGDQTYFFHLHNEEVMIFRTDSLGICFKWQRMGDMSL